MISGYYQRIPKQKRAIKERHREDHERFLSLSGIEKDEAYYDKAIKNIKNNPAKYAKNIFSNIGRILFSFPYSYTFQKPNTLLRLPFNGIIVVFTLIALIPTLLNWRKIDFSIRFCLIISFIYFGGSIVASAETRMFNVIVPVLLIWIGVILHKTVQFKLKFN